MSSSIRIGTLVLASAGVLAFTPLPAPAQVPDGFTLEGRIRFPLKPLCFDYLPGGDLIACDNVDLFTIDPQGGTKVIDSVPPNASIAFVRVTPDGKAVILGDSNGGDILRNELRPGSFSKLAHVPFSFDLVFDFAGNAFLSANPSYGSPGAGNQILLLDCVTGATKPIAKLTGPSGPVELSREGSLFYAVQSDRYPTPPGFIRILRFPRARLLAAIAGNVMGVADGQSWASGLDGAYDMEMDDRGRLLVSDPVNGGIARIGEAGGLEPQPLTPRDPLHVPLTLRFVKGGSGTFSAWQPSDAGNLFFVEIGSTSTSVSVLHPQRPRAFSLPDSPIDDGNFELGISYGPSGGAALVLLSQTLLRVEDYILLNGGDPLWYQVDPANIFLLTGVGLDASGSGRLRLMNPPGFAGPLGYQALVYDAAATIIGSSNPVPLTLR